MTGAFTKREDSYSMIKNFLIELNVNNDLIVYIDRLEKKQKEEFSALLSEIVEDESSHALALMDMGLFKEYLDQQKVKRSSMWSNNIVQFPLR